MLSLSKRTVHGTDSVLLMHRRHFFEGSGKLVTSALTRLGIMGTHAPKAEQAFEFHAEQGTRLLTPEDCTCLLTLARRVIGNPSCELKGLEPAEPAAKLKVRRATFVTLTKTGALRGCIGNIFPESELFKSVMRNARGAAWHDPRFAPVTPEEVPEIRIEISVLTEPERVKAASPDEILNVLRPHEDGVLLRLGTSFATFLPQVWAHIPNRVDFLERLCEKAGCDPSAWRETDAGVYVYQVESFHEPDKPIL